MFNYVDITNKGCEGWINLFFGDDILMLVSDPDLATKIKEKIEPRFAPPCPNCGSIVVTWKRGENARDKQHK